MGDFLRAMVWIAVSVLALADIAFIIQGLINPQKVLPKNPKRSAVLKSGAAIGVILIIAFTVLLSLEVPDTLEDTSPAITRVERQNGTVIVNLKINNLSEAFRVVFNAARWQVERDADIINSMEFNIYTPTRNRLGDEGTGFVMRLDLPQAILKRAHWEKISDWDLPEIVTVEKISRFGINDVTEYCKGDTEKFHPLFCSAAAFAQFVDVD